MQHVHRFSLVSSGVLGTQTSKLLVINGMEDSVFPIEDGIFVATQGSNQDLVAGTAGIWATGTEEILYDRIDNAVAGR